MIRNQTARAPGAISDTTVRVIAFDGDDTLWHNESIFSMTQDRYRTLLRRYVADGELDKRLFETETKNLQIFGYGVKGFMLSMIETAIEVSGGRVTANEIAAIIASGKAMLDHPVELLEDVSPIIEALRESYRLMVITKGDLFDQESKLARSGLAESFWKVEIVSEKDSATYHRIMRAHAIDPDEFLMVGNSVRSDILPVVAAGARAVHVPYHLTWAHEQADIEESVDPRVWRIETLAELPGILPRL